MSRRNALTASRSLRPSRACSTITVATTAAGTDGWLRPWTTRSANSSGGNSSCRWSASKAYTDPSGTRWRHQAAASNCSSDGWLEGLMLGACPPQAHRANYRIGATNRISRTTPLQQPPSQPVGSPGRVLPGMAVMLPLPPESQRKEVYLLIAHARPKSARRSQVNLIYINGHNSAVTVKSL